MIEGKELKGELSIAEQNKTQAIFILSGSGPTDRDGNSAGLPGKNNSLKYLAELITKEGFTTLRVDKRGIAASAKAAPEESELRFTTYVDDAKHWIKFLENKGYSEIIMIGHSEGALVATMAASTNSVRGLVCIAGAGRPATVVLREQLKPKVSKELYAQADKIITSLAEGKTVNDSPPELASLFRPSVQPYLISWFKIDPAKALAETKVPSLIIHGSTDLQTSKEDATLLHEGTKGSKLIIIEGMNHILKEVGGILLQQLPSYSNPDLPLHKDLVPAIIDFLKSINTQ